MKKLLILGGAGQNSGSGAENIIRELINKSSMITFMLASTNRNGGVARRADHLGVPFYPLPAKPTTENYQMLFENFHPDHITLAGYEKFVSGLPVGKVSNIHPGLRPFTNGLYGIKVHEKVIEAQAHYPLITSGVEIHFIDKPNTTAGYDEGALIYRKVIEIQNYPEFTAQLLQKEINSVEHAIQPAIIELLTMGDITFGFDGAVANERAQKVMKNL